MIPIPNHRGYNLLHEGALALAGVEHNGICIDVDYCERQKSVLAKKIRKREESIRKLDSKLMRKWKRVYGTKLNLGSNPQLANVLFNHLKIAPQKLTEKGRPSVDQESLELLSLPEVNKIIELRRLKKVKSTYIDNILRETVNGILHPFFNLHTTLTYRSSSNSPNFQNIPIRIPEIGRIIRRAFIPRPGNRLIEIDYSGIEVCIAACYHKDPMMIEYIHDEKKDMHRDMAMELYLLSKKQVSKQARYSAKNGFVFPEFYGDYYVDCAQALWKNITTLKLKTKDAETPLLEHLSGEGIKTYKKFERHVQQVEEKFWEERFPEYAAWKEEWVALYEKRGYIDTLTGFRCFGYMRKNKAINYPIQGSAFHCLLWSLVRLSQEIDRLGLSCLIVGQIHDSILFDCPPNEVKKVLKLANKIMCEDIRKEWPWIIVPLEIEAEITPVDGNWFEKKKIKIPN